MPSPSETAIDPIQVRRVNLIAKTDMPFERPTDTLGEKISYHSGDYEGLLDKTLAALDWDKLQTTLRRRRAAGEAVGAGLAMFIEKSGLRSADCARVTVDVTGAVELVTGGASLGQGFETAMAQICADGLGVDYKSIKVIHGRTDLIAHGIGAHLVACLGHDRFGHTRCRVKGQRESDERRQRIDADTGLRSRHCSRQCRAQGRPDKFAIHESRRNRPYPRADSKDTRQS